MSKGYSYFIYKYCPQSTSHHLEPVGRQTVELQSSGVSAATKPYLRCCVFNANHPSAGPVSL